MANTKRNLWALLFVITFLFLLVSCSKNEGEDVLATTESSLEDRTAVSDTVNGVTETESYSMINGLTHSQRTSNEKSSSAKTQYSTVAVESTKAKPAEKKLTFPDMTFENYDNRTDYRSKITKKYDEKKILKRWLYYQYFPLSVSEPRNYDTLNAEYPIECIRRCEDNVYAMYLTDTGGVLYVFFTPKMEVFYSAYSAKKLSYKDFESIKAGDSVEKVELIDPAVKAMRSAFTQETSMAFYTMHILDDGLFVIFYNGLPNENCKILKAEYYSNYIFNNNNFFKDIKPEYAIDNTDYNYRILNADHIH